MPEILELSSPVVILCAVDDMIAARRHLQRGLENPEREFFHDDNRVVHYRKTGEFLLPASYDAPKLDVPTITVSTDGEYVPGLDEIANRIQSNRMDHESIAKEIIEMKNADLGLRDRLIRDGRLFDGYDREMEALHHKNAERLNAIIELIGYPTVEKVGAEASEAAWLVIQHSIGQPAFMKKCAALLEKAVAENRANPRQLAYLTDRIAVFEGAPQLYGTQFDWDEKGEMNPKPFDDLEKVNARRKAVGLKALEEQIEIIRKRSAAENEKPPADLKERNRQADEWRKKVGWIK